MKKIRIEETTTYQEFTGTDGERYRMVHKLKDVPVKGLLDVIYTLLAYQMVRKSKDVQVNESGLREVVFALLAFSTVGLLICIMWVGGLRLIFPQTQSSTVPTEVQR